MRQWLDRARQACASPSPHAQASEWLLDNEFQVRRAIRQVQEDLPAAFYRRLRLLVPEAGELGSWLQVQVMPMPAMAKLPARIHSGPTSRMGHSRLPSSGRFPPSAPRPS